MPHQRALLPPAELALQARLADEPGNGLKRVAPDYVADPGREVPPGEVGRGSESCRRRLISGSLRA